MINNFIIFIYFFFILKFNQIKFFLSINRFLFSASNFKIFIISRIFLSLVFFDSFWKSLRVKRCVCLIQILRLSKNCFRETLWVFVFALRLRYSSSLSSCLMYLKVNCARLNIVNFNLKAENKLWRWFKTLLCECVRERNDFLN